MRMKKALSILLSTGLCLSLLMGCSAKSSSGTQNQEEQPVTNQVEEGTTNDDPVELNLWYTSYSLTDIELSLQEDFMAKNPNIKINNVIKEGDPGNDFYTAVAAGNAPDMVPASFTMMEKYMQVGILEPLNAYFDAYEEKDQYDEMYLDTFTKDGELLGLAAWSSGFYLGYNKAMFAEAGIENPPATWEEAIEIGKLLTDQSQQKYGYSTLAAEWTDWFFQYYVWQAGGDLAKEHEDGTLELTFTDPAVIKAGEFYQELKREGIMQSDLTLKFDDLRQQFAQGKIAMMPFGGDWISHVVASGMKPEDVGLALFPAGPSGESVTTDLGQCYIINAKTTQDKKDAAWKYIEFLLSVETLTKRAENMVATGAADLFVYPRKDFDIIDITGLPDEYRAVVEGAKGGRLEYPGKSVISAYVDRAVQTILSNPNADVKTEFEKAQKAAQSEVVDDYNVEIKKK